MLAKSLSLLHAVLSTLATFAEWHFEVSVSVPWQGAQLRNFLAGRATQLWPPGKINFNFIFARRKCDTDFLDLPLGHSSVESHKTQEQG